MGLQLAACRGIRRWVESIFGHAMKRNPVVEESSMGSFRSKLQCLGTRQIVLVWLTQF